MTTHDQRLASTIHESPDGPTTTTASSGSRRAGWWASLAAGLVTATVVLAVGVAFAMSRPQPWTAEALLLVEPDADTEPAALAGYYEILGQGIVGSTYAELLRPLAATSAADDVEAVVGVVPGTTLISIRGSAASASAAESAAAAIANVGVRYLNDLDQPYDVRLVDAGRGSARQEGPSLAVLAAVAVLAGIAGLAVQQAWSAIASRRGTKQSPARDQHETSGDRPGPVLVGSEAEPANPPSDRRNADSRVRVTVRGPGARGHETPSDG